MFVSILFFLFIFLLVVISIGASLLSGILKLFFGRRASRQQPFTQGTYTQSNTHRNQSDTTNQTTTSSAPKKREKIFDASEGEYVDFEEIKD